MSIGNGEKVKMIGCLTNDLDMVYHTAAFHLNVSDSVLWIMYVMFDKGDGCYLHDVCTSSGLSKQTINSAIRKLENDDILYLVQDKGKHKKVFLTDKGKEYLQVTAVKLFKAECAALSDWSEEEFNTYLRLSKKHLASLKEQIKTLENKEEK